jgi:type I restriction enzyme S subunit
VIVPHVRIVPSSALARWDVKHVLGTKWLQPPDRQKKIGQVLRRRRNVAPKKVRLGTIHFDGSLSLRAESSELKGTAYLASPGNVVFSKIDVRNGAITVVPEGMPKIGFSAEYPIYEVVDTETLLPEFVALVCRTSVFKAQVQALAVGHSGRKRVSPEEFEELYIPVLPAADQRKIVANHRDRLAEAREFDRSAKERVRAGIDEITEALALESPDMHPIKGAFIAPSHALDQWSIFAGTAGALGISLDLQSKFKVRHLGDPSLATIGHGIQKSPRNRPDRNSRPYLRVKNVQDGFLDLSEIKYIDVPESRLSQYQLEPGDVLLCEGNSAELVGRPAIWSGEIEGCVHQNHVMRIRCNRDELLPEYLLAFMQTRASRGHFRRRAKKTTNLATINSADVKELQVPVPPLPEQRRIARIWGKAQADGAELRKKAHAALKAAYSDSETAIVGG